MSFFPTRFDNLRTNAEFKTFIEEAENYKNSTQYLERVDIFNKKKSNMFKEQICKKIMNHFNNDNLENAVNEELVIYIGDLTESEKNDLKNTLTNKGYSVSLLANDLKMKIV